jgi:hypothetical protein
MCLSLGGAFAAVFLLASVRRFFALEVPTAGMIATAAVASALAIGGLALAGFTPTAGGDGAIQEEAAP